MRDPKIFSFFSGSGLLDLGFENSSYNIVFVNEFSQSFMNAYRYSRKKMGLNEPEYGYFCGDINCLIGERSSDLRVLIDDARKDGSFVGFIGGPPCPDFSVGGKNKGREGDNGKLSQSYVDLICKMMPDFFLFENVKGLIKTEKHRRFFEDLKIQLRSSGYILSECMLNSLNFGVPQDRDRIMLFGIRTDKCSTESINVEWKSRCKYNSEEVKQLPWPDKEPFVAGSVKPEPNDLPLELSVQRWFDLNDVSSHPNQKDCFIPRAGKKRMETIDEGDVSKKCYKRLHRWRYSPTAAYGNNEVHLHPFEVRRISVAEAMSIQSLPREFELPEDMSLTDKFKTVGNGVPYLMAKGIAETLYDYLEDLNEKGLA